MDGFFLLSGKTRKKEGEREEKERRTSESAWGGRTDGRMDGLQRPGKMGISCHHCGGDGLYTDIADMYTPINILLV